jgi:hypothetical protein
MSRSRERAHRVKHHAPLYSPPPRLPSKLRRVFDIEPEPDGENVDDQPFSDLEVATAIKRVEDAICDKWTCNPNLPDCDEEESSSESAYVEDEDSLFDWEQFDAESGLSAWDQLGEGYESDAAKICKFSHCTSSYICVYRRPLQRTNWVNLILPSVVLFRTKSRPIPVTKTIGNCHTHSHLTLRYQNSTDCAPALLFWQGFSLNSMTAAQMPVYAM